MAKRLTSPIHLPLSPKSWRLGLRERFWRWVEYRSPVQNTHHLTRKNLFIFPSQAGIWYLVVVLLLWLLGTNFENNLVLAFAFLLTCVFVVAILHSFANLNGVSLQVLGAESVFSGEVAEVSVQVSAHGSRARENLCLRFAAMNDTAVVNLVGQRVNTTRCYVEVVGRGWINPGRLFVTSYFPLGIIRCWTRLKTPTAILVYPAPIAAGPLPLGAAAGDEGDSSAFKGADEFAGFRDYAPGDSLKNIAWKHYARGVGMFVKEHNTAVDRRLWLDWEYFPGMGTEARLSRLCYWVLEAHKQQLYFGLRLPGSEISPDRGEVQRDKALRALALFDSNATEQNQ